MATAESTVTYREIPGYPGRRVGDDGSVWSAWRKGKGGKGSGHGGGAYYVGDHWRMLKPGRNPAGYRTVQLSIGGRVATHLLHRLVLEVFVGPCPEGLECCHGDGDKSNNALANLRWDTREANAADRKNHGTNYEGELNPSAKLTPEQVVAIWNRCSAGEAQRVVAKGFSVSHGLVGHIMTGRLWGHLTKTLGQRQ